MGHHHSKGRPKKSKFGTGRPVIEHTTHQQHKNQNQPDQYFKNHYTPSQPRPIRTSKTSPQPFWRDPSPPRKNQDGSRGRKNTTHHAQSFQNRNQVEGFSFPDSRGSSHFTPVKRNAKSLSPNRLPKNDTREFQTPRKLKEIQGMPLSKSAPAQVVELSGRRGRSPGRVFCLVRCRSEPSNSANQLEPFPYKERKSVSVSPPRKSTNNQRPKNERKNESLYTNDEIAISFEQVEPQTYRVVGGVTTLGPGPVPVTNQVAPRRLRRTFPQQHQQPKSFSPQRNIPFAKSVSESRLQSRGENLRFTQPPIPPRRHRLRDLSHLVKSDDVKTRDVPTRKPEPTIKPFSMSKFERLENGYRSPSRSPYSRRKREDSGNLVSGSVETIESISTQSGSYHMPSSGPYTPNERSLVESPYGFDDERINQVFEDDPSDGNSKAFDSLPKSTLPPDADINFDLEQEYIYQLRGRSRSKQSRAAEPRPFDPGGKYFESDPVSIPVSKPKSISKSLEDASPRRSLLWSNPAPFGSQKAQNVIRHVEAPRAKVEKTHQPPPPVQKFSPAGRYSLDPSKFSPEKQHSPTRRSDQSPENPVRKSIYKDIFETLYSDIPVTPQPPKPVKSSLPKTIRPSIDQIVRGLAQNAFLRDDSPLRKSVNSHRANQQEEDRLLRELSQVSKSPRKSDQHRGRPIRNVKKLSNFESRDATSQFIPDPTELSRSNFSASESSFQKFPDCPRTDRNFQKIPHHPLSQAGSRTVEVVYVPPKALKNSSSNFSDKFSGKSRSRFDPDYPPNFDSNLDQYSFFDPNFNNDPPIILSDDGQGTNFIDLTLPPPVDQPKLRDSWILPV